ncbi:MAG: penicillin-binding protein activator [Deltaproteobacteria bacterium]|jgi:ABC-type branched-subunit amino acid transport system substrate-binding protein|nr:penicillin-binding protein activator [Deltaproteobacteria bacterium]
MSRRSLFPLIFFLLFLASCVTIATTPGGGGVLGGTESSPEKTLAQAEEAFRNGNFQRAEPLYRAYLEANPQGGQREGALFNAALSSERNRDWNGALNYYGALARDFPTGTRAQSVQERIPLIYLAAGKPEEALNYARSQPASPARALAEGKALFLSRRYGEAIVALAEARGGSPEQKREAESGVEASLNNLSPDELSALAQRFGANYPGPEAVWYMALHSAKSGDQATFAAQREYFRTYFPQHPWLPRLDALAANPQGEGAAPSFDPQALPALSGAALGVPTVTPQAIPGGIKVAAILPLSGEHARRSQEVLAGLRLAFANSGASVAVAEMDTEGKPGTAVRLVGEASTDPAVLVAVGPLVSPESLAAAQTAQQVGMPLIAISQRLGLTVGRPLVFRIFLTPKHQAEAAARYAVLDAGFKSLGVLYPDDAFGKAMLEYFQAEAQALGATVTARESYNYASGNWKEAVDRITGGASVRRASTSYQAAVSYEALYLPDSAPVVSQLAPQIAFNDVTRIPYLGSPLWVTADLPASAGRYLNNSAIPTPFSSLSLRAEARAFADAYRAIAGREPDQFAAYGYDAGVAILTALAAGATDRVSLARALNDINVFPGATGPFTFDAEGDYSVSPVFLTVKDSEFALLKDAQEKR